MTNQANETKVKRESKNKIRVEFDRTPLLERLKGRYLSTFFLGKIVWYIFRLALLIGVCYVILFPFYSKISSSFMSAEDFVDVTVRLVPKYPTLDTYEAIITENGYLEALLNTFILSVTCALIQTFVCSFVGYGFAKFKFKFNKLLFMLVVFTMIVPHSTLQLSMFMEFRYFDILGIMNLLGGGVIDTIRLIDGTSVNLINTYWPLWILSVTALAFKNGLYIFMLRQFFSGIPDELEESAAVDGAGVFRTFITIVLPNAIPMMITVFMFAFSWQWTDNFYTDLFYTTSGPVLMPDIVSVPLSLATSSAASNMVTTAVYNTCGILILAPLLVMYVFLQKYIIQGIERSGITG